MSLSTIKMNAWPMNALERFLVNQPFRYWMQRLIDVPILLEWSRLPKRSSILEVGCGPGRVSRYLSQHLKCKNYTAVDIDPKVIAHAESLNDGKSKVIFQVADVCDLPFEDNSYDAVVMMDTLHHVVHWKTALREIHRVLKKKGKLLLREYSIETFSFPVIGLLLRSLFDHPYEHMFDQKELLSFVRKNGFHITHENDMSWLMMLVAVRNSKT